MSACEVDSEERLVARIGGGQPELTWIPRLLMPAGKAATRLFISAESPRGRPVQVLVSTAN